MLMSPVFADNPQEALALQEALGFEEQVIMVRVLMAIARYGRPRTVRFGAERRAEPAFRLGRLWAIRRPALGEGEAHIFLAYYDQRMGRSREPVAFSWWDWFAIPEPEGAVFQLRQVSEQVEGWSLRVHDPLILGLPRGWNWQALVEHWTDLHNQQPFEEFSL